MYYNTYVVCCYSVEFSCLGFNQQGLTNSQTIPEFADNDFQGVLHY